MKRPEDIKFVKQTISVEVGEKFGYWLNEIEDAAHDDEGLKEVIRNCKLYYGDKFNEIFDEDKLNLLHDNWIEIAMWEFNESLASD